jgi:hypothetical protein
VSAGRRERSVTVSRAGVAGSCGCCKVSTILESPRVRELSWVLSVAPFCARFDCESEVICGGVKEISGTKPSVNNLESGVNRSIWDVGEVEDLRG